MQTEVESQQPSCLFLMSLARFCSLDMHRLLHCTDGLFLYHTHIQIVLTHDKPPPGAKHTRTPLLLMLLLRFQRTVCGCSCSLNLKIQISGKLLLIFSEGTLYLLFEHGRFMWPTCSVRVHTGPQSSLSPLYTRWKVSTLSRRSTKRTACVHVS